MKSIQFVIPWPPSVNHYWGRRRNGALYILPRGLQFRRDVANIIGSNNPVFRGETRLAIIMLLTPPDKRKRDIDNILKATFDAIEHTGVIDNDANFKTLVLDSLAPNKPGQIKVFITNNNYFGCMQWH